MYSVQVEFDFSHRNSHNLPLFSGSVIVFQTHGSVGMFGSWLQTNTFDTGVFYFLKCKITVLNITDLKDYAGMQTLVRPIISCFFFLAFIGFFNI